MTTDHRVNAMLSRSSIADVYGQVIEDLKYAEENLNPQFLNGALVPYIGWAERVRPTSWAASALLARVRLYTKALC